MILFSLKNNIGCLICTLLLITGFNSAIAQSDSSKSTSPVSLTPKAPKPAWAPDIKPEMQVVIEKLISLNGKPIESLTAKEARLQPTPTDAVMGVMKDYGITPPTPTSDTIGKEVPVKDGSVHVRIYKPKTGSNFPVIVYFHGGGFVIATIDTYDASAEALSEKAGAIVVSVEYRKGPEYKFPTAHNDCFAAYEWTMKNAASWGADTKKIAVVGESAGGNLAANVSIMARDKGIMIPVAEVLVYPIANNDMKTSSYLKNENAKPLNKPMMAWFTKNYVTDLSQAADPKLALVKANLKGLPPTIIITAEIDPLHDDGLMLAEKMKAAGVKTEYKNFDGVTHEFFGMATVVPEAKQAQDFAVQQLQMVFNK